MLADGSSLACPSATLGRVPALEKYVSFVDCKTVTGEAICGKIMSELKRIALDPNKCRTQAHRRSVGGGGGDGEGYSPKHFGPVIPL